MSIRRKGARSLTVRDRRFVWTVRRKPTYAQSLAMTTLNVAAALAGARGTKLVARLGHVHPANVVGRSGGGVTPAEVARCIERALDAGWKPELPGPPFVLHPEVTERG